MSIGTDTEASREAILHIDPEDTLSLKGSSVLIVDEDPAFQLGLKTFLKEYVGFSQTFTARNGREALQRLAEEPSIAMVTLDYKMPEMDGIEFLEALRKQIPRPIGVIMITGYPSDELEETFRSFDSDRLRAIEFVAKPVEFTELETIIHRSWEDLQKAKARVEAEQARSVAPVMSGDQAFLSVSSNAGADAGASPTPLTVTHDTTTIMPIGFRDLIEARLNIIGQKVDKIESTVNKVESRVPSRFGRFFMGLMRVLLAIALFWGAAQLGWLEKASDFLKNPTFPSFLTEKGGAAPEAAVEDAPSAEPLREAIVTPEPDIPAEAVEALGLKGEPLESTSPPRKPIPSEILENPVAPPAASPLRALPERLGDDGEL